MVVRPTPSPNTLAASDHLELRPLAAKDGSSHHGDPAEEEVIVVEEPERPRGDEPRVARASRAPTQKEIDAHEATHIPHEEWGEACMADRGRKKPHRKRMSES